MALNIIYDHKIAIYRYGVDVNLSLGKIITCTFSINFETINKQKVYFTPIYIEFFANVTFNDYLAIILF